MDPRSLVHQGRTTKFGMVVKGGGRAKWKDLRWVRDLKGGAPHRVPAGPLWHPDRQAREKYRTRVKKIALRGAERSVLDYLLVASDDGLKPSWPSQERMANELHLGERTVERAVAHLKELGLLVVDVCMFVQSCEERPRRGRSRPNGFRRPRTNRYYFVIDIADHRGQLGWFRRQVHPAPNSGAGPEQPHGGDDGASIVNLDGTTPERNTGPPPSSGDIPTSPDRSEDDQGPRRIDPRTITEQIAEMRSGLQGRPRSRP